MHCPLRTPHHIAYRANCRGAPAICRHTSQLLANPRTAALQRQRAVCVRAAKTLYEALGVSQNATDRDIKRAYRQKALKLHPDVNKAPNAEAQFLEVKNAFTVLSDAQQRAQYDRKLNGGFGDFGSWGSSGGFGDFGSWSSSSSSSKTRSKQQEEDFYGLGDLLSGVGGWVQQQVDELVILGQQAGEAVKAGKLEDFFKDLEKEVDDWSKKRSSSGSSKPASLWEELAAIGEEFVDFLEQGLKDESSSSSSSSSSSTAGKEGSSSGGSSSFNGSARRSRSPADAYEELKKQYDLGGTNGRSSTNSSRASSSSSSSSSKASQPPPPPPPPPKKSPDDDIEDMLAALKKKMNKA